YAPVSALHFSFRDLFTGQKLLQFNGKRFELTGRGIKRPSDFIRLPSPLEFRRRLSFALIGDSRDFGEFSLGERKCLSCRLESGLLPVFIGFFRSDVALAEAPEYRIILKHFPRRSFVKRSDLRFNQTVMIKNCYLRSKIHILFDSSF